MTNTDQRIDRLEAAIASQHDEIERLKSELEARSAQPADILNVSSVQPRSTRRMLLAGGAVAAGAAVVGAVAGPQTVAAADGGNVIIGADNTGSGNTRLRATVGAALSNTNILTASDNATSSSYPAAIGAVAQGDRVTNGVYAYTSARDDLNSGTGHAIVARKTSGGRSAIYIPPSGTSPMGHTYAHGRGELFVDSGGNLWCCVASGTPGSWRRLAGPASAGAVHAIDPRRTYDSRFTDGALASDADRVVSVADGISVATGVVELANIVPEGATAVFFNLAITETTGEGFLQLAPASATEVTAATVNWGASNVTTSNASFSAIDENRQVKVLAGGAGATQFTIDITGYTL
ncbi:MAG: hypothetical protein ACI9N0_002748 [Ilumatobacter sp.]|jgi:hypothetical protein